jgi:hypothetical protein
MATIMNTVPKLYSLFHEVWRCGHCGREFADCTACCAHESQCGDMTRC